MGLGGGATSEISAESGSQRVQGLQVFDHTPAFQSHWYEWRAVVDTCGSSAPTAIPDKEHEGTAHEKKSRGAVR